MNTADILIVNACSKTRPITRALSLVLVEQRRGTQTYRSRSVVPSRPTVSMMNARGGALDVCIRTAEFFGRHLTFAGSENRRPGGVHRHDEPEPVVMFLGEDEHITAPSLAAAVEGELLERTFYPDILVDSGFPEVRSTNEAATGFAAGVSRLCGPHQVVIVLVPPDMVHAELGQVASGGVGIAKSFMKARPVSIELPSGDYRKILENVRRGGASTAELQQVLQAAHAAYVRRGDSAAIVAATEERHNAQQLVQYFNKL